MLWLFLDDFMFHFKLFYLSMCMGHERQAIQHTLFALEKNNSEKNFLFAYLKWNINSVKKNLVKKFVKLSC